MKSFVLDSGAFHSLESFFVHADQVLCRDFTSGHNMNAFHDILRGGFGRFEYEEPIEIVWRDTEKAKRELGEGYQWLTEAIRNKPHITFREEKT
jgi:RNAse (barnase) inhibitor barstar